MCACKCARVKEKLHRVRDPEGAHISRKALGYIHIQAGCETANGRIWIRAVEMLFAAGRSAIVYHSLLAPLYEAKIIYRTFATFPAATVVHEVLQ